MLRTVVLGMQPRQQQRTLAAAAAAAECLMVPAVHYVGGVRWAWLVGALVSRKLYCTALYCSGYL